jgi:sulfonate transport system substrate-binding protein
MASMGNRSFRQDDHTGGSLMTFARCRFVCLALCCLLVVGGPWAAEAAQLQKLKITQAVEALQFIVLYVARANGYLADEGYEAEVTVTAGGGPEVQALIAKEVDFAATGAPINFFSAERGKPVVAVHSLLSRSILNVAMRKDVAQARGITPDSPMEAKLKALKGLTVGVTRPGSLSHMVGTYFVRQAGLRPQEDTKLLAIGGGDAMVASLAAGKIDAFVFSSPMPETSVRRGDAIMLINNAAGEYPPLREYAQNYVCVRPEFLTENPEAIRKVVRALTRANQWVVETPPPRVAAAIQRFFPGISPDVLEATVGVVKHAVRPDGIITDRSIEVAQEVAMESGLLKAKIPIRQLVNNGFH